MDIRSPFARIAAGLVAALSMILGGVGPASAQRGEEPPSESPNYQVVANALYTAPLGNFDQQKFDCSVVNVGKQPIKVKARIFDEKGTDISDTDMFPYELPCDGDLNPGAVCRIEAEQGSPHNITSAYCRIIVVGSKESVRGVLRATTRASLTPDGQYVPQRSITTEAH